MARQKVLITVTTYPLPSRSYDELVCTAGVLENGQWIRIYPVPLQFLKGLKGKEFDKAYVDNEVTYHQTVLDAIDKTLIPSARNEELKALIVKVRPAFAEHLEHAKHLQSTLK